MCREKNGGGMCGEGSDVVVGDTCEEGKWVW